MLTSWLLDWSLDYVSLRLIISVLPNPRANPAAKKSKSKLTSSLIYRDKYLIMREGRDVEPITLIFSYISYV